MGLLGTEAFQAVAKQGREGMQIQRRGSQETAVQPWGRVFTPPKGHTEWYLWGFFYFFFNRTIKPVDPKGNQSWIFTERTDAVAETPNTLASWFEELTHWKRPWRWERLKVRGEGDDRGWDGWMESLTQNGHEFEQALGVSVGQGGLACCGPWGRKD